MPQPLDTTLLATFLTVAETGSFSGASAKLNCVQSNITARIRRLEDRLGGRLFERGRGGAALTAFGRLAQKGISEALDRLSSVEKELTEASGGAAPLRLGAMETTAAARLPRLLAELRQHCPDASVTLQTAPTARLLDLVWNRRLDAAFVAGPVDGERFHATPAFDETLVALWLGGGDATGPAPQMDTLLAFGEGCSYRAAAQAWLRQQGRADVQVTEMGSLDAMIGCAAAGMGMTVVPQSAAIRVSEAKGLTARPLPAAHGKITTYLVRRHDEKPLRALNTLGKLLTGAMALA